MDPIFLPTQPGDSPVASFGFQLGKVGAVCHRVGTSEKEVALCVNGHHTAVLIPVLLIVKHPEDTLVLV